MTGPEPWVNHAVKHRGQWTGVHLTPSNGRPTVNVARQVAKRLGISRKAAALLLLDAAPMRQADP